MPDTQPYFNTALDPKCNWAIGHMEQFPVEIMKADYEMLLRVPGIGPVGARRILSARRAAPLSFDNLKKLGVVLKRAQYFITCGGKMAEGLRFTPETMVPQLEAMERGLLPQHIPEQLSLFDAVG